jgi:hypothetical protein
MVDATVAGPGEAMAGLLARGDVDRGRSVVGGEVVLAGEARDVSDLGQQPCGDDRTDAEDPGEGCPGGKDGLAELDIELPGAPVEGAHVAEVVHGDLAADPSRLITGSETSQDRGGLGGCEFSAHTAGRELGQDPMQAADGLGPQSHQLRTPVA